MTTPISEMEPGEWIFITGPNGDLHDDLHFAGHVKREDCHLDEAACIYGIFVDEMAERLAHSKRVETYGKTVEIGEKTKIEWGDEEEGTPVTIFEA